LHSIPPRVGQGNVNLANIEKNISASLTSDLNSTLGGDYFHNVKFNLAKIDLDPAVQKAISTAQASFADVSQAQADLRKAQDRSPGQCGQAKGLHAVPGVRSARSACQASTGNHGLRAGYRFRDQPDCS
jgi:hypothetical protein